MTNMIDKRIKKLIVEALEGATVICEHHSPTYGKIEKLRELSEWWDSDEEERND